MGECDTIFSILSPPKTFPIHHYKLQLLFHRYKVKLLYFTAANNFPILYHYQLFHHHTYIPNHQPLVNVQTKPMFYLLATLQQANYISSLYYLSLDTSKFGKSVRQVNYFFHLHLHSVLLVLILIIIPVFGLLQARISVANN